MSLSKISPKHLHFIGIGGSGMSGLAEVLNNLGYIVTGSDISETSVTERLKSLNIKIESNHKPSNLGSADMVVISTAIDESNLELKEARKLSLPVLQRAELLSSLMNMKRGIAIAGTHGKTTTTSMLGTILDEIGLKPTIVVGGIVKGIKSNSLLLTAQISLANSQRNYLMAQYNLLKSVGLLNSSHLKLK